jgi:hypothetical protein
MLGEVPWRMCATFEMLTDGYESWLLGVLESCDYQIHLARRLCRSTNLKLSCKTLDLNDLIRISARINCAYYC